MAFSSRETLMSMSLEETPEYKLLPNGHYYAQIMRNENVTVGEKNTDAIDFYCQVTEAGEDVDQSAIADVDLRQYELRARFFITDRAMKRLKDFFLSLGFSLSQPYDAIVAETTGRRVLLTVTTTSSTRRGRVTEFNNVDEIVGVTDEAIDSGPVAEVEETSRRRRA